LELIFDFWLLYELKCIGRYRIVVSLNWFLMGKTLNKFGLSYERIEAAVGLGGLVECSYEMTDKDYCQLL